MSEPRKMINLDGYQILEAMEGGMARVYKARHISSGRLCALKVLKEVYAYDVNRVERFHEEATVTRGLRHRNIVKVYDDDCRVQNHRARFHYFVMEYVDGIDIQQLIDLSASGHAQAGRKGPLSKSEIIGIVSSLCDALDYAHTFAHQPVVHRDLKPNNVMIEHGTGRVVLMDFGIAKSQDVAKLAHAGDMSLIGTAEYMSPEHAKGDPLDPRSDLYSLGVIMYEMATGQAPFTANGIHRAKWILEKHIAEPPPLPRTINPNISPSLEAMILILLEKDPNKRYQSAKLLKDHLNQHWTTETGSIPLAAIQVQARRKTHFPLAASFIALILLLFMGAGGYLTFRLVKSQEKYVSLEQIGIKSFDEGDWEAAVSNFEKAMRYKRTREVEQKYREANKRKWFHIASEKESENDWRGAKEAYEKTLTFSDDEETRAKLADAQKELDFQIEYSKALEAITDKRWNVAIAALEKALKFKGDGRAEIRLAEAKHNMEFALGLEKEKDGDWESAIQHYEKALESLIDDDTRSRLENARIEHDYSQAYKFGLTFLEEKKWGEAAAAFENAIKEKNTKDANVGLNSAYIKKHLSLASEREQQRDWDGAIKELREALKYQNELVSLDAELAEFASVDATRTRLNAARYNKCVTAAETYEAEEDWENAARSYTEALEFAQDGRDRSKLVTARKGATYKAACAQGELHIAQGNWDDAIIDFGRALQQKDTDEAKLKLAFAQHSKWLAAGDSHTSRSEWKEAIEAYTHAATYANPYDSEQDENVKTRLTRARKELAYQESYNLGIEAYKHKRWDDAVNALQKALEQKNTNNIKTMLASAKFKSSVSKGDGHAEKKEWSNAVEAYARALDVGHAATARPDTTETSKNGEPKDLGVRKSELDEINRKLAVAKRMTEFEAAVTAGKKALADSRWDEAITALEKALAIETDLGSANAALAGGKFDFKANLRSALCNKWLTLAMVKESEKDWDAAAQAYTEASKYSDSDEIRSKLSRAQYNKWMALSKKRQADGDVEGVKFAHAEALKYLHPKVAAKDVADNKRKEPTKRVLSAFERNYNEGIENQEADMWAHAVISYRRALKALSRNAPLSREREKKEKEIEARIRVCIDKIMEKRESGKVGKWESGKAGKWESGKAGKRESEKVRK